MNKKEILDILDNAKDEKGSVPMRLVRQALDKLPTIQPVATDTNVGDTISRKGVFIPDITVEMFRNASLESVEDLMASGEMEDISLLSAQPKQKWILCSERLPEEGQNCLVCDKGSIGIDTYIGHGNPYNWKWYVRDYEAWMPLPEPYQSEVERRADG